MYAIKESAGRHWPYVECLALDSDITPSQTIFGPVEMQVRITDAGRLFIKYPDDADGPFVDCLSLMKALRMAFPITFAEVSYGASPAYDTFARELAGQLHYTTTLD